MHDQLSHCATVVFLKKNMIHISFNHTFIASVKLDH